MKLAAAREQYAGINKKTTLRKFCYDKGFGLVLKKSPPF